MGTNTTLAEKKNGQSCSRQRPDLSQIIYYNFDKKGYYAHKYRKSKKIVAVLAISICVTASTEARDKGAVQRVLCIWYPIQFQENQANKVQALIDSGSKFNTMTPTYTAKLGLTTGKTSVGAQKIDGLPLETHDMASARFSLQDSLEKVSFFEETFLLADTSIEIVLGMLFLAFSNANFQFGTEKLTWRSYTTVKAWPTTSQIKLIDQREFAKTALDEDFETFVVYVTTLEATTIYPSRAAQIAPLQWDKAPTEIPAEYFNYADMFSVDLAIELPENTSMNEHAIQLIEGKQPPYGPIYTLNLVELETLKAWIKTPIKTGFIRPSKSLVGARILFDKKSDNSLYLYMNYWGLNNLTIKNQYPFLLLREALDCLGRTKWFT